MAAKRRVARPRTRPKAKSPAKGQLAQLRAKAKKLSFRLAAETRLRKLDQRMLAEARRARLKLAEEIPALRARGLELAADLGRAMRNSRALERARQRALANLAELREELRRKREELRHTSMEFAKLARESAARARALIVTPHLTAEQAAPRDLSSPLAESSRGEKPHTPTQEPLRSADEETHA
jgi:chromosome segregation ATPase